MAQTAGWVLSSLDHPFLYLNALNPGHDIRAFCVCDGAEKVLFGCCTGRTQTPFFEGGTICEKILTEFLDFRSKRDGLSMTNFCGNGMARTVVKTIISCCVRGNMEADVTSTSCK